MISNGIRGALLIFTLLANVRAVEANTCGAIYSKTATPPALLKFSPDLDQPFGLNAGRRGFFELKQYADMIKTLLLQGKRQEAVTLMAAGDLRPIFFRIEGFATIYEDLDAKFFSHLYEKARTSENNLGSYSLVTELQKTVEKIGDSRLIVFYEQKKAKAADDLISSMVSEPWLSDPGYFDQMDKSLRKLDWKKPKKDRELVRKMLTEYVHKLRKKVEDRKYSQDEIEVGLHALRRRLRAFLIDILALDGMIDSRTDNTTLFPQYQHIKYDATTKDTPLGPPFVHHPISIQKVVFNALAVIVGQLGVTKDQIEAETYISEDMVRLGISKNKDDAISLIREKAGFKQLPSHKEYADQMQKRLEDEKILKTLEKQLEDAEL